MGAADLNGNRTSSTDTTAAGTFASSYCYDQADRLTSMTTSGAPTGAGPVIDGLASTDLVYDGHGHTTKLADQGIGYDAADQHVSTTVGASVYTYDRDATGRVVQRTGPDGTTRFVFAGAGESPVASTTGTGTPKQRLLSLPGGVQVSIVGSTKTWSYTNMHGDVIVSGTTGGSGTLRAYDPFGVPIDTTAARGTLPRTTRSPTRSRHRKATSDGSVGV